MGSNEIEIVEQYVYLGVMFNYNVSFKKAKDKQITQARKSMLAVIQKAKYSTYLLIFFANYVNPICCIATVCHQVRCMYWGHLGYFHRAISHLKWYKIVCMRYLACIFCQMKSIDMFSMFLQSGVPRNFLSRFIAVWIYNLTVFMFMHVNVDLKV